MPPDTKAPGKPNSGTWFNSSLLFGYDFFISFTLGPAPRGTMSYASDLARCLRERDYTVFFSEDEASPGAELDSTLRRAVHRTRVLVVVANQAALSESKWIREEVKEFRARHPKRPVVPISVGRTLEQLDSGIEHWLEHERNIWLNETSVTVAEGIASPETIQRLAITPRSMKANTRLRWTLAGVMMLLSILTVFAWFKADEARTQRDEAVAQRRNAESRAYSARALLAVETDPAEALPHAIKAGELGDNPDSEAALRRAIGASHLETVFSHDGGTTDAEFASDHVVTVGNDGHIRVWDVSSGRRSQTLTDINANGMGKGLRQLAISPDATRLAVLGEFGKVGVWSIDAKQQLHPFDTFNKAVHVGFSPNGADVIVVHGASVTRSRSTDGSDLRTVSGTVLLTQP